jgi:leucyl-tRNA synthetase
MVKMDGITMSSSKRHGVWLGDFLKEHGADVCKLAVLFAAPPEKEIDWTNDLVVGVSRFLSRIKALYEQSTPTFTLPLMGESKGEGEKKLYIRLNQTIKKVIDDSEKIQYNTAIAALMEFLNDLTGFENKDSTIYKYSLGVTIKLLAPFAPHISEYLWLKHSGKKHSVFEETLPEPDSKALTFATITIPIQIQGKLRSKVEVAQGTSEKIIKKLATDDDKVKKYIEGKKVKQIIYVANRLINIVLE